MDIDSENLRDIAIKLANEQAKNEYSKGPLERSIFILGSKGCGKTTLFSQLLEHNEAVRPTLALDYSFARKTSHAGQSMYRQVCHLWELGGATRTSSEVLAGVPLMSVHKTALPITVILMLDLSRPKNLWIDLEETMSCLKLAFNSQLGGRQINNFIQKSDHDRIIEEHADAGTFDPFPLPLIVVGGKYDIFRDHDPEIKKRVCKTLRSCCHLLAATLFFYSHSEPSLVKKAKELLDVAAFGYSNSNKSSKGICKDYNKPIFIPFGLDTWSEIGTEPQTLSAISLSYSQWFLNESFVAMPVDDPAADPAFREDEIDAARALKDDELKRERNLTSEWDNY